MKLYYVHDPMCSWCWGFRPTWAKIRKTLENKIEIQYIVGGLAPDTDAPMPNSMKQEIAGYWKTVQEHIPGTEFNFDFWDKCTPKRSTYPACRAILAARKQNPDNELDMIEAIQKAYYLNAQNPSEIDTLIALADSLALDVSMFESDIKSDALNKTLKQELLFARKIGARGFPSMILGGEGNYSYVPLNYNDPSDALFFIEQYSKNISSANN